MSQNKYTAVFEQVEIAAAQDLFSIQVPNGRTIQLLYVRGSQSSDAGDSEAEVLPYTLKTFSGDYTIGDDGDDVLPENMLAGGPASGCIVRSNDTTQTTGGDEHVHHADAFDVQAGLSWPPLASEPNEAAGPVRIECPNGTCFVVSLDAAPDDALTGSFTIAWLETSVPLV